jgi:hypothetical protein
MNLMPIIKEQITGKQKKTAALDAELKKREAEKVIKEAGGIV